MRSDWKIRELRRKHGREALTWSENERHDVLDDKAIEEFTEFSVDTGKLLGPVIAIGVMIFILPFLALWIAVLAGVAAWITAFFLFPRTAPLVFAIGCFAVLLAGIGPAPRIDILWVDFTFFETGNVYIDGPLGWVGFAFMASSPVLFFVLGWLSDRSNMGVNKYRPDPGHREPHPVMRTRTMSVLSTLAVPVPLLAALPAIAWNGVFGPAGIAPADGLDAFGVMRVVADYPVEVLAAGLRLDLVWPGGLLAGTWRVALCLALVPGLLASVATAVCRRRVERQARKELAYRLRREAEEREAERTREEQAFQASLPGLVARWARERDISDVFRTEDRIRRDYPNIEFPFSTGLYQGRVRWLHESRSGLDPHSLRLFTLWIRGIERDCAARELEALGHTPREAEEGSPLNKISLHWNVRRAAAG